MKKTTASLLMLGVPELDIRAFSPLAGRMSLYDSSGDGGGDSGGSTGADTADPGVTSDGGELGGDTSSDYGGGGGDSGGGGYPAGNNPDEADPNAGSIDIGDFGGPGPSINTGSDTADPGVDSSGSELGVSTPETGAEVGFSSDAAGLAGANAGLTYAEIANIVSMAKDYGLAVKADPTSNTPLSDFSDFGTAPGSEAFANFTPDDFALAYAVTGGYGQDPAAAEALGMHSPGISYADIITAKAMGMGKVDVSPTQTVDQALAAQTVHSYLNNNIVSLVNMMAGPAAGAMLSAAQAIARGHSLSEVLGYVAASLVGTTISNTTGVPVSGQTVTDLAKGQLGKAALSVGINAVSKSSGLPVSTVTAIAKGNLGAAAAQTIVGEIISATASNMGTNPAIVGTIAGITGTTSAAAGKIANTINSITAPLNNAIAGLNNEISSIGVPGGLAGVANEVAAIGGPAAVPADGSASNATTGDTNPDVYYGSEGNTLTSETRAAVDSQRAELETIAAIVNGTSPYDSKYDYDGDGKVTSTDLRTRAEQIVNAQREAARPSTSDKYWANLYNDLRASPLSEAPVATLVTKQDIIDQYNADLREMVVAGFPTFDLAAYKKIYGLTDDTEALERFLDEGQFKGELTNNTEYQRAIEAVDLLLADPTQDDQDYLDLLDQYKLPQERVSEVLGNMPADDLLRSLDSRVTTSDEVIEYFNEFVGRDPTVAELAEYQGKPQPAVEPALIRLGDIEATTFDGSQYDSLESAVTAARLDGYNAVEYGGKTLVFGVPQTPRQQLLSPAASDAAFRAAIQPKPYDGSKAKDQFTAAKEAYAQGASTFTFGGKTYNVPADMGGLLIQAAVSKAEYIKARDDYMAEAGDAVSPPVVNTKDATELGTLKSNVESAVKIYEAAAKSGDPTAAKLYLDKVVEAQNAYQAKKDFIQTRYAPDGGTAGILIKDDGTFGPAGEYAGLLDPAVKPAYDNLSAASKQGTGQFMQWLGTAAFAFDSAEGRESTGLYLGLSKDNALVKAGAALEAEGESELSSLARLEKAAWLADVAAADGYMAKSWAAIDSAIRNPVGFLSIAGTEAFDEAVPTVLVGGVVRLAGAFAGLGTNALMNATETYGNQWGDTYDLALKKGMGLDEARTAAYEASLYSALATAAVSSVGDTGLVKALAGDLSKLTLKGLGKETLKQYITESTEGGSENLLQQLALNGYDVDKVNFDQVKTAAAIEGTIGAIVSAGYISAASAISVDSVIGVDANGNNLTLDGFLSGRQTVSSLDDVNFNAAINAPDGSPITLQSLSGAMLTSDPAMMGVWESLPPAFFESAVDGASLDAGELRQYFADAGIPEIGPENLSAFISEIDPDFWGELGAATQVAKWADPRVTDAKEAEQFLRDAGYDPTQEEIAQFIGQIDEDTSKANTAAYADRRTVTAEEIKAAFEAEGYTPTDEQVNALIQAGSTVEQDSILADIQREADLGAVTADEVRAAYAELGLKKPTDADIEALIGQYAETDLTGRATENLDNARYNSIIAQLDALSVGANQETLDAIALVKSDLTQQLTDLGARIDTSTATLTDTITDVETNVLAKVAEYEAAGLSRDEALQTAIDEVATELGTTTDAIRTQIGSPASVDENGDPVPATGVYAELADISTDVQAKYDALTAEQKALADTLIQQGIDLNTAIETATTQLSGQITDLSTDVQTKYDALTAEQKALADQLTKQGVDLNTAIEAARTEVMTELENTAQILGKPARDVTQADIDAISEILAGIETDPTAEITSDQRAYDTNNDGVIDQQDIDTLNQILAGNNVDWVPPEGSIWAPTGLYGELSTLQTDFEAQLAEMEAARQADARRAAQQARVTQGQNLIGQIQDVGRQMAAQAPKYSPIYGGQSMGFVPGQKFDPLAFRGFLRGQDTKNQNKMAQGGYVGDTDDEFESLLRMLQS